MIFAMLLTNNNLNTLLVMFLGMLPLISVAQENKSVAGVKYTLLWADEFNEVGLVDISIWQFENGFVRNEELQWYQSQNAYCFGGNLVIEGRHEKVKNPHYSVEGTSWKTSRDSIKYTSASINTKGNKEVLYGLIEVRAKIPTASGAWPAIWTLGNSMEWPSNGEIDILEYYQINTVPHILANFAWGTDKKWDAKWNSATVPFSTFKAKDDNWEDKFHVWQMKWTEDSIHLFIDDQLMNQIALNEVKNGSIGNFTNPFRQPHYLLLNLAIGGVNGGIPDDSAFPLKYYIDYVRVYTED